MASGCIRNDKIPRLHSGTCEFANWALKKENRGKQSTVGLDFYTRQSTDVQRCAHTIFSVLCCESGRISSTAGTNAD